MSSIWHTIGVMDTGVLLSRVLHRSRTNVQRVSDGLLTRQHNVQWFETLTGLYPLAPCMVEARVANISTFLEPITASSTATAFYGLPDHTALRAYGTDGSDFRCGRRRSWRYCIYVLVKGTKGKALQSNTVKSVRALISLHSVSRGLLQACTPSSHVWSKLESPSSPHFLNQEPPRAQQLSFPDFLLVPHLKHTGPTFDAVAVVEAGVGT